MATTNIAKISAVINVTVDTNEPRYFFGQTGNYYFNSAQDTVFIQIGNSPGINLYAVALADLRVNGQSAPTVTTAKTLLNAIFGT